MLLKIKRAKSKMINQNANLLNFRSAFLPLHFFFDFT